MDFDFGALYNDLIDFLWSLVLSAMEVLNDLFITMFDAFMTISVSVISTFGDMFSLLDFTQYVSILPDEVKNVLGLLGIGTATSMIVTAILIRLGLQLIPFVRLGS